MSFHYTVCVSINVRRDASATDVAALDWLFNANGELPQGDPGNNDLATALQTLAWLRDYAQRPDPTTAVAMDIIRNASSAFDGGQLYLFMPGQKLEAIFEDWLFLLRWLATIARDEGFLASVVLEDGVKGMPLLFFAYGGKLFMNSPKDSYAAYSVVDDERREVAADD